MNRHFYRIIFNHARSSMMVVAAHVKSHAAGAGTASPSPDSLPTQTIASRALPLRPMAFALMWALGMVGVIPNPANVSIAHAEIIADPAAPASQRPMVLNASQWRTPGQYSNPQCRRRIT